MFRRREGKKRGVWETVNGHFLTTLCGRAELLHAEREVMVGDSSQARSLARYGYFIMDCQQGVDKKGDNLFEHIQHEIIIKGRSSLTRKEIDMEKEIHCKRCNARMYRSRHIEQEIAGAYIMILSYHILECPECGIVLITTIPSFINNPDWHEPPQLIA